MIFSGFHARFDHERFLKVGLLSRGSCSRLAGDRPAASSRNSLY